MATVDPSLRPAAGSCSIRLARTKIARAVAYLRLQLANVLVDAPIFEASIGRLRDAHGSQIDPMASRLGKISMARGVRRVSPRKRRATSGAASLKRLTNANASNVLSAMNAPHAGHFRKIC
jgi:hypothetical protein